MRAWFRVVFGMFLFCVVVLGSVYCTWYVLFVLFCNAGVVSCRCVF